MRALIVWLVVRGVTLLGSSSAVCSLSTSILVSGTHVRRGRTRPSLVVCLIRTWTLPACVRLLLLLSVDLIHRDGFSFPVLPILHGCWHRPAIRIVVGSSGSRVIAVRLVGVKVGKWGHCVGILMGSKIGCRIIR